MIVAYFAMIMGIVATQPLMAQAQWHTAAACSVTVNNVAASDQCFATAISANGRHVLFASRAPSLPGAFGSDIIEVYAFDRQAGRVSIVSAPGGASQGGERDSVAPAVSADGRFVALQTEASALVPPQPIFVGPRIVVVDRDRDSDGIFDEPGVGGRAVVAVSVSSEGTPINNALRPSISASGRFVTFHASTQPLLRGDATGLPYLTVSADVFVHDRDADGNGIFDETAVGRRKTVKVNVDFSGQPAAAGSNSIDAVISGSGRIVVFESNAINLVADDTNGLSDIFAHDRDADGNGVFDEPGGIATTRVDVSTSGAQANGPTSRPSVSDDGRFVAFDSLATNLVNVATNGVRQVYLRDRMTQTTRIVSARGGKAAAQSHCYAPSISADGRYVAFQTAANELVPGDTNGSFDVIVWDRLAVDSVLQSTARPAFVRASVANSGAQVEFGGIWPAISGDGRSLAFASVSTDIIPVARSAINRQIYVAQRSN